MPLRKAIDSAVKTEAPVQPAPHIEVKASKPYTGHASKPDAMTKADWAAKDVRISRQGLYQAALQSPAIMQYSPTLDEYLKLVEQVANAGLLFVNA